MVFDGQKAAKLLISPTVQRQWAMWNLRPGCKLKTVQSVLSGQKSSVHITKQIDHRAVTTSNQT